MAYWRIETSVKVSIHNHARVPSSPNFKVMNSVSDCQLELVLDIIYNSTREWKKILIFNTFVIEDVERIVWIPLA